MTEWYEASTLIRSPTGFSVMIICRSLLVDNQRQAQILILREALLRVKEFQVTQIHCRDYKKIWRKLLEPATPINWKLYPAFADIIAISSSLQVGYFQEWHPLAKEVRKMAQKAAATQVSYSHP